MSVLEVHSIAGGLDLVVGAHRIDVRVEIKDSSKPPSARRLTDAERKTMYEWRGRKPIIWECIDDVERTYARLLRESVMKGGN